MGDGFDGCRVKCIEELEGLYVMLGKKYEKGVRKKFFGRICEGNRIL